MCIDNTLFLTPPPKHRKENEYSKDEVLETHFYCNLAFLLMLLLLLIVISEAEPPSFGSIILFCSFPATYSLLFPSIFSKSCQTALIVVEQYYQHAYFIAITCEICNNQESTLPEPIPTSSPT